MRIVKASFFNHSPRDALSPADSTDAYPPVAPVPPIRCFFS